MLRNKKKFRLLSLLIIGALIFVSLPLEEVKAAEDGEDVFVITSFDKLDEWKMERTIFKPGTETEEMNFPTEWSVKGYLKSDETKTELERKLEELVWKGRPVTEEEKETAEEAEKEVTAEEETEVTYTKESEPGEYLFEMKLPENVEAEEKLEIPSQKILIAEEVIWTIKVGDLPLQLVKGDEYQLEVTLEGEHTDSGCLPEFRYTVIEGTDAVTVDAQGKLTMIGEGRFIIQVECDVPECVVCDPVTAEGFAMLEAPCEHQWKEASCTEPKTCTVCHETQGEPLGHAWDEWTTTKKPTTKESGLEERICSRCKEKETREIPRLNVIGKPENNTIKGIREKGIYGVKEVITITAHGDGMDIEKPIKGDVRYLPLGWKVTSYSKWKKERIKYLSMWRKKENISFRQISADRNTTEKNGWIRKKLIQRKSVLKSLQRRSCLLRPAIRRRSDFWQQWRCCPFWQRQE